MRQDSPTPLYRGITALALALLGLALSSCLESESSTCESGLLCPAGMRCATQQDVCIAASPSCGDGIVQASENETCDDGNILSGDGCSQDCQSSEICGNGRVDKNEVCDDSNTANGDGCSSDCRSKERCGNGITDYPVGEVCDDGNAVSGDHCSFDCRSNEQCGNGTIDREMGELCDDGNTVLTDACGDCRSGEGCGNGIHEPGEQCDDGNTNNNDNCLNLEKRCVVARCGDGITDTEAPNIEECDDGNSIDEDSCLNTCKRNICGDNRRNPVTEACDDGNRVTEEACPYGTRDCTACNEDCSAELPLRGPYCGDREKNGGERCDDGYFNGAIQCHYGEELCYRCNANCTAIGEVSAAFCGDAIVNVPYEECDFGAGKACGTCSAGCRRVLAAPAKGTLTIVNPREVSSGDSFVISDGLNPPVAFRFDSSCSNPICDQTLSTPLCCIKLLSNRTSTQLADAIQDVINTANENEFLEVSAEAHSGRVNIQHLSSGTLGNQSIITSDPKALKAEGMSGGVGFDCAEGSQCMDDEDCAQGLVCRSNNLCGPL